ncbi:copper chaperone [Silvimonas terrae]|uniref:Copper chaperone n=1 Tax=Silvimonas terrae TaxID=300266 RepID=A0A840RG26_9NEIS|nr:heavy-metal-associated domain-containing protein [Silvimonas terrae]MBB5192529.1 copper chaperone [Silvimonas terrae]
MQTATLNINGMSCSGCASTVSRVLKNINGVQSAAVNLDAASALVEFDPALTGPEAFKAAVEDAGYDVV